MPDASPRRYAFSFPLTYGEFSRVSDDMLVQFSLLGPPYESRIISDDGTGPTEHPVRDLTEDLWNSSVYLGLSIETAQGERISFYCDGPGEKNVEMSAFPEKTFEYFMPLVKGWRDTILADKAPAGE